MAEYQLVRIEELCGTFAGIYSFGMSGSKVTEFDKFLEKYETAHLAAVKAHLITLGAIAQETGARETFLKPQGKIGEEVYRLISKGSGQLQLYCITIGPALVVLGDGFIKPSKGPTQSFPEIDEQIQLLKRLLASLKEAIDNGQINWDKRTNSLEGDLTITLK